MISTSRSMRIRAAAPTRRGRRRRFAHIWASPVSALGLVGVSLALVSGGGARRVDGVVEAWGGWVAWGFERTPFPRGGVAAMALGHVVLGRDERTLRWSRAHERVHVAQCERWGPFFPIAYLAASVWAVVRGGHAYLDNVFEREAREGTEY